MFIIRPYRGTLTWEYDIKITRPDGRRIQERRKSPVSGKQATERWVAARENILMHGEPKPVEVKTCITFAEFEPRFITGHVDAQGLKPSSKHSVEEIIKNHLRPRFGSRALDSITLEDVQTMKGELRKPKEGKARAPKTINCILTVLKTMLRRAEKWGVIGKALDIELLREVTPIVDFYDGEQFEVLVKGGHQAGPEPYLLTLLGGEAGLRLGEVIALEWADIDFKRDLLTIRHTVWRGQVCAPKGGKIAQVNMTERLAAALKAHRHLRGTRVLYRPDGRVPSVKVMKLWMGAAQRAAGMPETRKIHILRHTFCSRLAMLGATPKAIQELARHQSLAMTLRYMHLSPAAKQNAIALLEPKKPGEGQEKPLSEKAN